MGKYTLKLCVLGLVASVCGALYASEPSEQSATRWSAIGAVQVPRVESAPASIPVLATVEITASEARPVKYAAPRKVRRCVVEPLNVAHVHSTDTDVRIKGDGNVTVCTWGAP